jgi:predicted O-linked N-acetylglucosamine transferase (SPINDLY family)
MHAAIEAFDRAVVLAPDNTNAQLSRAQCRLALGQLERAIEIYREALRAGADPVRVRSRLLMALQYSPRIRPRRLRAEVDEWASTLPSSPPRPPLRHLTAGSTLKVGFVSADIRDHPVGQCIEALVSGSPEGDLEHYFYVTQLTSDTRTQRIRSQVTQWHDTYGWSDAEVAEQVRTDGIDILIDLSGHSAGHRLGLFAMRPAPVQVSWLGYFASTGVPAMDFVLGDPVVLPESASAEFSEAILRLDRPYGCFMPPELPLAVTPPPCLMQGHITLGCFNNLLKLNAETAELWAEVMAALPDSHLLLKSPALSLSAVRQRTSDMLTDFGIAEERVRLEGATPRLQHLGAYGEVDIALDTWPCSGGITSAEAIWMGVPVVTLPSDRFAGRITADLLQTLGHPEWVASDRAEYVSRVVALGQDRERLIALRRDLRPRFVESPLCDGADLARALSAAMRTAWRTVSS